MNVLQFGYTMSAYGGAIIGQFAKVKQGKAICKTGQYLYAHLNLNSDKYFTTFRLRFV
jgi:hypothetical protein